MTKRDRSGRPLGLLEWADLWKNMDYRVVADDQVDDVLVRTVWEGIDDEGSAMFFTGVQRKGGTFDTVAPAGTEEEARMCHRSVVDMARGLSAKTGLLQRLRDGVADASRRSS